MCFGSLVYVIIREKCCRLTVPPGEKVCPMKPLQEYAQVGKAKC